MGTHNSLTEDGFEIHFGVNHLGHFLLTVLLIDMMLFSAPSRIIVVASDIHSIVKFQKEKFNSELYNKVLTYAHAKLLNILFAKELANKLQGTNVTVNCLHPGAVYTDIGRNFHPIIRKIFRFISWAYFKTANEGAQTQIKLAVDPELENVSGKYFAGCKIKNPSSAAQNDENAKWLWEKSLKLLEIPDFSVIEFLNGKNSGHCSKIVKY